MKIQKQVFDAQISEKVFARADENPCHLSLWVNVYPSFHFCFSLKPEGQKHFQRTGTCLPKAIPIGLENREFSTKTKAWVLLTLCEAMETDYFDVASKSIVTELVT